MPKPKRPPHQVLLDTLKQSIAEGVLRDVMPELSAPTKMQALRVKDKTYRTVPISQGDELMLSGVRLHARGDRVIFEFKPDDPDSEYVQFELDDTKVFRAFPDLESLVVRVLGFDAVDTDDNPVTFAMVKGQFLQQAEIAEEKRIEDEAKAAERKTKTHYEDHPLFGMFG